MASVDSRAYVDYGVVGTGDTGAAVGQSLLPVVPANKEAVAYGSALPSAADANALLVGSPVSQDFDFGGSSQAWLIGNLGVLNTATDGNFHSYSSQIYFNLDTASFSNQQSLLLGLLSPVFGASNLGTNDTLTFTIDLSGAGGSTRNTYTFADLQEATNLGTQDLGTWAGFVTESNTQLAISLSLNLYSQTNLSGIDFNYVLGNSTLGSGVNVPVPAAFWLFGSALVGWGFKRRK